MNRSALEESKMVKDSRDDNYVKRLCDGERLVVFLREYGVPVSDKPEHMPVPIGNNEFSVVLSGPGEKLHRATIF